MLLTKEEATKKWCPMARVTAAEQKNELIDNRQFNYFTTMCIADKCMLWKWESVSRETRYCQKCNEKTVNALGYCGLNKEA